MPSAAQESRRNLRREVESVIREASRDWGSQCFGSARSKDETISNAIVGWAMDFLSRNSVPKEPDAPAHSHSIWLPGTPRSWGVGRHHPRMKSKSLATYQEAIGYEWRRAHRSLKLSGPVVMVSEFHITNKRQDLTNLVKAAEDGLKHVAFGDDVLVYRAESTKIPAPDRDGCGAKITVKPYRGPAFQEHLK